MFTAPNATDGLDVQSFVDHVGIPRVVVERDAQPRYVLVPSYHPEMLLHYAACLQDLVRKILTYMFFVAWSATNYTLMLARSPFMPRERLVHSVQWNTMARCGPESAFSERLRTVKREFRSLLAQQCSELRLIRRLIVQQSMDERARHRQIRAGPGQRVRSGGLKKPCYTLSGKDARSVQLL